MKREMFHSADDGVVGYIPFNTDAPDGAVIKMSVSESGEFWMSANAAGFRHLARVFADLGLREFPEGYHFHKNGDFKSDPTASGQDFSFGLISD